MDAPLVVPLEELTRDDLPIAGGKGANLGELVRAGFDVPGGFVVTTAAYDAFVAGLELTAAELVAASEDARAALFTSGALPDGLTEIVTTRYAELGGVAVAVRSSATAEDLPDASFAGQQETLLNVEGVEAVLDAIRGAGCRCGRSARSPTGSIWRPTPTPA